MGITHRDVSAGNLLLGGNENSSFIIDLGLANLDRSKYCPGPNESKSTRDHHEKQLEEQERSAREQHQLIVSRIFLVVDMFNLSSARSIIGHVAIHVI